MFLDLHLQSKAHYIYNLLKNIFFSIDDNEYQKPVLEFLNQRQE